MDKTTELEGAKAHVKNLQEAVDTFDPDTPLGKSWPLDQRKKSLLAAQGFLENCKTDQGPWV